ncbi:MAG: hypothetical protein HYR72_04515 [Deltaproteobacteria bacterium]|nr:hypothetical protein [Deltaproteobacteria bacterium]MBI3389916.1 hypothetical protein [Deltaproteobacteria bacterium]
MRRSVVAYVLGMAVLCTTGRVWGNDGQLDRSFGASYNHSPKLPLQFAAALALQPDGKLVIAGSSANGSRYDLALVRCNSDGSLDPTFGTNGLAKAPLGSTRYVARGLVLQSDGKLVVGGTTDGVTNADFALARFNADGSLDSTFGGTGVVTTAIGAADDALNSLVVQSDGKLVAAGTVFGASRSDFGLARYAADGALDATFGNAGIVTTSVGTDFAALSSLALQSDGRVVAAGWAGIVQNGTLRATFALARYNADGGLDAAFGNGGQGLAPVGSVNSAANALVVQPDGKLVAAGFDGVGFTLARYDTAGSLDPTFGNGGSATAGGGSGATSLALQADGKLITAGLVETAAGFAIRFVRHSSDGIVDGGFGNGGVATVPLLDSFSDTHTGVLVQPDGKPVAVEMDNVVRCNANGTPDNTFGIAGTVRVPIGFSSLAFAVVAQPDNRLVVAGISYADHSSAGAADAIALARFEVDGTLDATFGNAGVVTTVIGTGASANALVRQPDGKLTVAGSSGSTGVFTLVRYNAAGGLDSSFGTSGIVTTSIGQASHATALVIHPSGKLTCAGYTEHADGADFAVSRYNPDGSLDPTFGTGGIVTTPIGAGYTYGSALARQSDGKVIVAGASFDPNFESSMLALARYTTDGSLDTTFGDGGIVTTSITGMDAASALVLQPDGKLVVVGYSSVGETSYTEVVRYDPQGLLDATFGNGGVVTTLIEESSGAAAVALDPDGRIVVAGNAWDGSSSLFALARYDVNGGLDSTFGDAGVVTTRIAGSNLSGSTNDAFSLIRMPDGKLVTAGASARPYSRFAIALARYEGSLAGNLIPGRGAATGECLTEWMVLNTRNPPTRDRSGRIVGAQTCIDNDPSCDFDGGTLGSCTFNVSVCARVADPSLPKCAPSALASYDVLLPSTREAQRRAGAATLRTALSRAAASVMTNDNSRCSHLIDVVVPLGITQTGFRLGRQVLMSRAKAGTNISDLDLITFTCKP